ncbi:MAG: hypothetical protein JWQ33_1745 [Ramlibacter sp.]|nr:hypothetical protein [Ramlibacter sp.]
MKTLIAAFPLALLIAASPALVSAQAAAAKPAAKTAAKPAAKKASTAGTSKASRAAQKAAEESRAVDDDPSVQLTPADLEAAKLVTLGDIPCELGATVHITQHKREGFFIVRAGIQRFRMHPVESRTGAVRLEDPVAGAMWLQLGNKSMLMSQKMGKRLADDCMNPAQSAMNEELKKNPINILEKPPIVRVVAPARAPENTTPPLPAAEISAPAASAPGPN